MDTIISNARIENLEDIRNLNQMLFDMEEKDFHPGYNLNWAKGELGTTYFTNSINDETACTLVARVDGKIIGYLIGWIWKRSDSARNFQKRAELENMFVLKEFRKKGIGSKLVHEFFKWCREKGVDNIRVSALYKNENAIEFYKKLGFEGYEQTLEFNSSS